jgi:hypothetical protein
MKKTGWGNDPRSNRTAGCIVASPSRRASTVRGACSVSSGSSHPGCFWRHCLLVRRGGPPGRSAAGERMMGLARACGGATGRLVQGIAASDERNGVYLANHDARAGLTCLNS